MRATALRSLLFFLLAPGVVAGFVPLVLLRSGPQIETGGFAYLAFPLWTLGTLTLVWCFWDFLVKGRGTPAPLDPPKELVVSGCYRYVRNPMYVGVFLVLAGHFLWFKTYWLLIYLALVFAAFSLFVRLYEEPTLKRTFGAAYDDYLKTVPRWLPRLRS